MCMSLKRTSSKKMFLKRTRQQKISENKKSTIFIYFCSQISMNFYEIYTIRFVIFNSIILQRFSLIELNFNFFISFIKKDFPFALCALPIKRTPSKKMYIKRTRQLFQLEINHLLVFCSFAIDQLQNSLKLPLANIFRNVTATTYQRFN